MYYILPNPNKGKKVKVISKTCYHYGKIGVIDKVKEEEINLQLNFHNSASILVKFSATTAKTHTPYNFFTWFDPDELEEVKD